MIYTKKRHSYYRKKYVLDRKENKTRRKVCALLGKHLLIAEEELLKNGFATNLAFKPLVPPFYDELNKIDSPSYGSWIRINETVRLKEPENNLFSLGNRK